ncbi:MAG: adenosylcobinamide-phosphate synthase CbiB [Motiliproteus sp.]
MPPGVTILLESLSAIDLAWWLMLVALLLDRLLGELRCWHPLVGFGRAVDAVEKRFNREVSSVPGSDSGLQLRLHGTAAMLLLVGLPVLAVVWLLQLFESGWWLQLVGLYFCIGRQSLVEHARAIALPLLAGDFAQARLRTSYIVSRNTESMDEADISKATVESVLENGNDACFTTLFWFAVAGLPGALAHRLVNTLDAMWGYRTPQYLHFGWAAARFDDLLAWLPARLCALSYALVGQTRKALTCWRQQAPLYDSPNGGPTMAAGAGALAITLGGAAVYQGKLKQRTVLGCGPAAQAVDIERSLQLFNRALLLWLLVAGGCYLLASGMA